MDLTPLSQRGQILKKIEPWFYFVSLLCVGLPLCLLTADYGAMPQAVFSHDTPAIYDAGWRAYCGIKPHVDFYSPLGPIIYLYVATGFVLFGLNVDSLAYINALSLAVLLCFTWFSLHNRIPGFWLFWVSLLVGLCFMAPHPLRYSYWMSSYAMLYNRQGYSLLMLIAFLLFSPKGKASSFEIKSCLFFSGFVLAVLFFLKISYFIAGFFMTICFFLIDGLSSSCILFVIGGFSTVALPMLAYLNFDLAPMLCDLTIASKAKQLFNNNIQMQKALFDLSIPIAFAAFQTWVLGRYVGRKAQRNYDVLFFIFMGCAIFITLTNCVWGDVNDNPLLAAFLILIVIRTLNAVSFASWQKIPFDCKAMLCLSLVYVASYVTLDILSITYRYPIPSSVNRLDVPLAKDLILYPDSAGPRIVQKLNDGFQLIRRNGAAHAAVMSFDFTSIFSFALQSNPCGGSVIWSTANEFSRTSYPQAARVFNKVDFLLVPLNPEEQNSFEDFEACYGRYIDSNFQLVDKSKEWLLMKRRVDWRKS